MYVAHAQPVAGLQEKKLKLQSNLLTFFHHSLPNGTG